MLLNPYLTNIMNHSIDSKSYPILWIKLPLQTFVVVSFYKSIIILIILFTKNNLYQEKFI